MRTRRVFSFCMFGAVILWGGCADLKNGLPAPVAPGVQAHESNWVDKTSPGFHGTAIRNANWDMRSCKTCHGQNYNGGTANVSCSQCHAGVGGPENCSTCHGSSNPAPPRDLSNNTSKSARGVGAHQIHFLGSSLASPLYCNDCHVVPGGIYDAGHIDATPHAEVVMNNPLSRTVTNKPGTANYSSSLPLFTPNPAFDPNTLKCSSTYCHGSFKNGNTTFAPVWNDASGSQMACGTCHGDVTKATLLLRALPKTAGEGGTHPGIPQGWTCANCHGEVVNASTQIIDASKHINGKLNLGPLELDY